MAGLQHVVDAADVHLQAERRVLGNAGRHEARQCEHAGHALACGLECGQVQHVALVQAHARVGAQRAQRFVGCVKGQVVVEHDLFRASLEQQGRSARAYHAGTAGEKEAPRFDLHVRLVFQSI